MMEKFSKRGKAYPKAKWEMTAVELSKISSVIM